MASRVHLLYPQIPLRPVKFQSHPFPHISHVRSRAKPQTLSCTKISKNPDFSSDLLTKEVEKMNTRKAQREEAMKKSRYLLFTELSKYLGLSPEELKMRLMKMEEEDKWVLVKAFVSEWSVDFHPLSARSVKEMVQDHLVEEQVGEDNPTPPPLSSESSPSDLFPGLKRMIGF